MSKYGKLPSTPFKNIAFNAGTLVTEFDPTNPTIDRTNIVGATTGGSQFTPNLDIINLFEDVDNAKANSKQGVYIRGCDPHLTTTLLTVGDGNIQKLIPNSTVEVTPATSSAAGLTQITPADGIVPESEFFDIWVITDYATMAEADGQSISGFFAIHMKDCIDVNGFQQQTTADGKVQYSCDFRAHYDVEDDDQTVPYEIFFSDGAKSTSTITITAQPVSVTKTAGDTASFSVTATTSTGTLSYQWQSKASGASSFSDIASATSATLALTASEVIVDNDGTQYRCVVSNGTDTETSNAATLTVSAGV